MADTADCRDFSFLVPACDAGSKLKLNAPDGSILKVGIPRNVNPGDRMHMIKNADDIWVIGPVMREAAESDQPALTEEVREGHAPAKEELSQTVDRAHRQHDPPAVAAAPRPESMAGPEHYRHAPNNETMHSQHREALPGSDLRAHPPQDQYVQSLRPPAWTPVPEGKVLSAAEALAGPGSLPAGTAVSMPAQSLHERVITTRSGHDVQSSPQAFAAAASMARVPPMQDTSHPQNAREMPSENSLELRGGPLRWRTRSELEADLADTDVVAVRLETTKGRIVIEVVPKWAPEGAHRFLQLVADGFFDQLPIHRAIPNTLVEFGLSGPYSSLMDDPFQGVPIEVGSVMFKASGPHTRRVALQIYLRDCMQLGGKPWETPIGRVVAAESLETLSNLFTGYGDAPEGGGMGPDPRLLEEKGNTYITKHFPYCDFVVGACPLPRGRTCEDQGCRLS